MQYTNKWQMSDKERWDSRERRGYLHSSCWESFMEECSLYQDLETWVGFQAGVLRRLGVEDYSWQRIWSKWKDSDVWCSMAVTLPNMPLFNDTPTVLPLKSTLCPYLLLCFQWGRGRRVGREEYFLQCSFTTYTQLARLPPSMYPTFPEHSLPSGTFLGIRR